MKLETDSGALFGLDDHDPAQLKIIVVSSLKTGNTWTKHLLSAIYDLPIVDLDLEFHPENLESLGPRWIGQQHYYPTGPLLEWAKEHDVVFVTTVRHPCDVFVSLYHYTVNYSLDPHDQRNLNAIARQDAGQFGPAVAEYIRSRFFLYLNNSISWARSGRSHVVRYEDLWRDPVATLIRLTSQIHAVELDRIERSIERCNIDLMRKRIKSEARFFRQGKVGNWRRLLSPEIVDLFRTVPPYPEQFAALGYTLDPSDPLVDAPPVPRALENPFRETTHFENGTEILPVMIDLYFSLPGRLTGRWESIESTRPTNTFYAWLNSRAAADSGASSTAPLVTNLMEHIRQGRADLRSAYPEPFGRDRARFVHWFVEYAVEEYEMPRAFVDPVETSLVDWARLPSEDDPYRDEPLPTVTNLVCHVHGSRKDLRSVYPDLYGAGRIPFLLWFLQNAPKEYRLPPQAFEPAATSFLAWSTLPSIQDPWLDSAFPIVTNLGAALYGLRPELQEAYPDLYGLNRVDFSVWFTELAPGEYDLEPRQILPVLTSWARADGAPFFAQPNPIEGRQAVPLDEGSPWRGLARRKFGP